MSREREIREILDEDKKYYLARYELERKAARMNQESYAPPNRFERAVAFNIDKNFIDLRAAIDNVLATQAEADASKVIQLYEQTVRYIDAYAEKRGLVQRDVSVIEDKFDALKPSIMNLVYMSTNSGWRITEKLTNIEENIENRTYSFQDIDLPVKLLTQPGESAPIDIDNEIDEPVAAFQRSPVKPKRIQVQEFDPIRPRRPDDYPASIYFDTPTVRSDLYEFALQGYITPEDISEEEFIKYSLADLFDYLAYKRKNREAQVEPSAIEISNAKLIPGKRTSFQNSVKTIQRHYFQSLTKDQEDEYVKDEESRGYPRGNGMPNFSKQMGHTEGLVLPKKKGRGKKMLGGISNTEDIDVGLPQGMDDALKLRAVDKKPSKEIHFAPDNHLSLDKRMMFLNQLDTHAIKDEDEPEMNSTRNLYRAMEKRLKKLK